MPEQPDAPIAPGPLGRARRGHSDRRPMVVVVVVGSDGSVVGGAVVETPRVVETWLVVVRCDAPGVHAATITASATNPASRRDISVRLSAGTANN